jgi:hypothetical protein
MSATVAPSTRRAVIPAVGLYPVWVLATYLLEARIHTLLRPEAMNAKLSCALIANLLIGIGGSALVIRFLSRAGTVSTERAGFRGLAHAATARRARGRCARPRGRGPRVIVVDVGAHAPDDGLDLAPAQASELHEREALDHEPVQA